MNDQKKAVCCEKCLRKISLYVSPQAGKLWLNLCDIWVNRGPFMLADRDPMQNHEMKYLEQQGYILTTEQGDDAVVLQVKVTGVRSDADGIYFCCGKC